MPHQVLASPQLVYVPQRGGTTRLLVALAALAGAVPAAAQTWTGNLSNAWNNGGNWSGGVVPLPDINRALTFGAAANYNPVNSFSYPPWYWLNSLTYTAAATNAYSQAGQRIEFQTSAGGTLPTLTQGSNFAVSIANDLYLHSNLTVNTTGTGLLTLGGAILGPAGMLIKTGSGTAELTQANTFAGLRVDGGTLNVKSGSTNNLGANFATVETGTLNIAGGGAVSGQYGVVGFNVGSNGTVNVGGGTAVASWTSSDTLLVGDAGTGTLNITGGGAVSNTFSNVGRTAGGNGTVNVGGGTGAATWSNSSVLYVGNSGTGALNITGGGTVSSADGVVGMGFGGAGTANVGGGTGAAAWNNSATLYVGHNGPGTLNITGGGTVSSANGVVGFSASGNGTVNVGGGTGVAVWGAGTTLRVGDSGTGTLNIIGGGTVGNGNGFIGYSAGSNGTVNVGSGAIFAATWNNGAQLFVGNSGTGTLNIIGGGTVANTIGYVGVNAGSAGTVNVGGGGLGPAAWNNTFDLFVGFNGTGTLNITEGGTVTNQYGAIGNGTGSVGTVNVGGGFGASAWNNSRDLNVGYLGTGTLTITGGGTVSDVNGIVGKGTVNVGGGTGAAAWNNSGNLNVGNFGGASTLTIVGGGTVSDVNGIVGSSGGTVNVGGGTGAATWNNSGTLTIGNSGRGTLNLLAGGTVSATKLDGGGSQSSVNFNGGTLRITGTDTASQRINVDTPGGFVNLPTAGNTFTLTGTLAGTGTLTKTGAGTLIVNSVNAAGFTGGVQVNAGRLDVPNDAGLGGAMLGTGVGGTIRYTANQTTARTFNNAGLLEAASGTTLTLDGATVNGGVLRSAGAGSIAIGAAGAALNNVTAFNGTTINQNAGALAADNLTFGGSHTIAAGQTFTGSNLNYTASAQLNVSGMANVTNLTSVGRITVNGGGTVQQQNATAAAPMTLGGGSVTTVNAGGTINLGGSGATQLARLAGGVLINNGTVNGGRLVVDYGGLARGTGSYSVNPLTINGGQFSPGSSPGRVNVEAFIADPGSSYTFEINDGGGTAGPLGSSNLRGWDLTTVNNLTDATQSQFIVDATPGNRFTIFLRTLTAPSPPDIAGQMDLFNSALATQWLAFSVSNLAVDPFPNGFDPNAFAINTSGFLNPFHGGFSLQRQGNDLFIAYTPTAVPEPSALALLLAATIMAAWFRRSGAKADSSGLNGDAHPEKPPRAQIVSRPNILCRTRFGENSGSMLAASPQFRYGPPQ